MKATPPSPKSLFAMGLALFIALATVLFVGASGKTTGPETTSDPAVNPYAHVESSLQQAPRNEETRLPSGDLATRNAVGR